MSNLALVEAMPATREAIVRLQEAMSAMPQVDLSGHTKHYFADGMYCRELFLTAGILAVGKVHRHEHFFVVANGTVHITNGDDPVVEITGPKVMVSKPGTKRAVYAVTDATCMNVHRTDKTDLDEIESELIEPEAGPSLFDASNKPISLRLEN